MEFVSPSGRKYQWDKETPPTRQDIDSLVAYDASLGPVEKKPTPANEPSLEQVATGVATEVGASVAGQTTGAALAPVTFGISYPVLAFSSGVGGSIAAQKIEGKDNISVGRALFAGLVNLIPFSSLAKTAKVAPAIARASGRAALLGASEATATKIIDEQRLPTVEEVVSYAGPAALTGGTLEGVVRGGGKLWRKIARKTPTEVDAMIARGDITPAEMLPASASPDVNLPLNDTVKAAEKLATDVSEAPIKNAVNETGLPALNRVQKAANAIKAWIAPSRVLGEKIQNEAILSKNEVLAAQELGSRVGKDIDNLIKTQPDPKAASDALNAYLDGTAADLPDALKGIQPQLDLAREKLKDLQAKLIRNIDVGATPAADELKDKIVRSMDEGNYLTREFRFFTDKNYAPTAQQRAAALQELGENGAEYLNQLDRKKLSNVENRNYLPSAIDGFLKERKVIGPALLDYLGEIKDPGERIRGTLGRVARGVYRDQADFAIKVLLEQRGLASRQPAQGMNELFLKRYERDGSELYVQPHVQDALNQVYLGGVRDTMQNPILGGLKDLWNAGVGLSKGVKVLLNPPSYAVQVYGNAINLIGMGINPMNEAGRGLRVALSEYGPFDRLARDPAARRKIIEDAAEMTKYGIKGSNILDSDIRSSFERGIFSNALQNALDPFAKGYTVPDTVGRFVAWKSNQRMVREMFPAANSETVKRFAAEITNDTYQNYDRLSQLYKDLSKIGIVPQFAAFTAEFVRNQYNQGRFIRQMMDGSFGANAKYLGPANFEAMRVEAGRRMASLLAVYGITYAGIKAWNENHNVTKAKEEALKRTVLPSWDENRTLAITLSSDGKTGKYANPSYIIPHAVGLSALDQGLSGQPIDGIKNLLTEEFVGEGSFLGRSVYSGLFNVDPRSGKKISYETDKFKNAKERFGWAIEDAFNPGIQREVTKMQQALRGQGQLSPEDVLRRQAGVRINAFNTQDSAMFRIKESVNNAKLASADYSAARDYRNLSPDQIKEAYIKANSAHRDAMSKIIVHGKDLQTLGFKQGEIIKTMKDAGLGASSILDALNGVISDLPIVKRETPTDVWEDKFSGLNDNQKQDQIRMISRSNPQLARSLMSLYKSEKSAKMRGLSEMDSLLMSLGVSDGKRAQQIYAQAIRTNNPDAYINEMARKHIATGDVLRQIRMLQQANQ